MIQKPTKKSVESDSDTSNNDLSNIEDDNLFEDEEDNFNEEEEERQPVKNRNNSKSVSMYSSQNRKNFNRSSHMKRNDTGEDDDSHAAIYDLPLKKNNQRVQKKVKR